MSPEPHNPVEVFYSYAHEDELLRDELKKHLSNLKRQGVITDWYDRDITAGSEWDDEIKQHLESARLILLLISPDFMDSDYINDLEVKRAMERHEAGEARVIPVILRPVDWQGAPFSKLQALPTGLKPVRSWDDPDEAFLDITRGIRKAILDLSGPSASVPTVPDIPRPPTVGFVSRRDKDGHDIVERLREELAPERHQLVALWGAGGVGKTTLAAEAVRAVTETHGQRVIWISADGRPNFAFSTLLDDIAEQLGRIDLRPLTVISKEEALRPLIAAKHTLIVLDNLETIVPEEEALCKEFLASRVRCPTLITTRERIDNALLIPIAAMAPDEASEFLNRLIRQSPDPGVYEVLNAERILTTAEFNPLIVQWIIGQIDLAHDPEEVLTDLAQGEGDAAHRVFDRSYNLPQLDDGGRAVLLALALFTPTAGRPMVAAVTGMDLGRKRDKDRFKKAQQTLASLWLITKTETGLRLAVAGLTRELAKAKLDSDPRGKMFRPRFISRFAQFAQMHAKPARDDYNALEVEKDNLLTATDLAWAEEQWESSMVLADILAEPVNGILRVRGYWEDALRIGRSALEISRSIGWESGIAQWTYSVGVMRESRGDLNEARRLIQESLKLYRKSNNQGGIASCLHELAILAHGQGELEEARQLYDESLQIQETIGNERGVSSTLHQLASLAHDRGEINEAHRLYGQSVEISEKLGDQSGIASSLHALASLAENRGEIDEARRLHGESFDISKKLGDQSGIASSLHALAGLAEDRGEIDEARRLYGESFDISKKLGDQSGIASSLHALAGLAENQGEIDEAGRLYGDSFEISKKLGDQSGIASSLHALAGLAHDRGEIDEARRLYGDSFEIRKKLGDRSGIASSMHALAILAQDRGEIDEARRLFDESLEISKKLGDQSGIAFVLHQRSLLHIAEEEYQAADRLLQESLLLLKALGDKKNYAECLESIGNLRVAQGHLLDASPFFEEALETYEALRIPFRIASVKHSLGLLAEKQSDLARARDLLREAVPIFEKLRSPKAEGVKRDLERIEGKTSSMP